MSWKRPNVEERMRIFLTELPTTDVNTVIDVGTGDGIFARLLHEKYPQATVLSSDIRYYSSTIEDFLIHLIQALPFRKLSFDVLIVAQVMHYIPYNRQVPVLQQLVRTLSPKGILIVVEYDTTRPNGWIPFPISQNEMKKYTFSGTTSHFIHDRDRSRPKYACYVEKK